MIRKLQKRFVRIAVLVLTAAMVVVVGIVNTANLLTVRGELAGTVKELAEKVIRLTGSSSSLEYRELPQDDPARRKPDVSLARELLGWTPEISLEDGLRQTIDYFRNLKDF